MWKAEKQHSTACSSSYEPIILFDALQTPTANIISANTPFIVEFELAWSDLCETIWILVYENVYSTLWM